LPCDKQSIYLYKSQIDFNISQTTFINDKRHIQKCDQISPESTIYYIQTTYPKVHIITSSQVQYIKTKADTSTTPARRPTHQQIQHDGHH
jgi:hypothetical protein